ncbi:methyltransferase domain-containing protein [Micromonospora sp. CPCC 206060]|uniref:class I SAM-dependent methyltransferase n=1 Tax=Micromonospora sp. CPCC 206060 TaxID=3122406 RepID=UPI002FEFBB78
MALIAYDDENAAAYAANRYLSRGGLPHWRAAIERHLAPRPGQRVLDLGAGTGLWARAFVDWYGVEVVAVEPSGPMRSYSTYPVMLAGDADALPLAADSVDAAWLSSVVQHLPDLASAAAELRRVLRPGAPVLIRSVFPGRAAEVTLFRYFPAALKVVEERFPSVEQVCAAFAEVGFKQVELEPVRQVIAPNLRVVAAGLRRQAHSPLLLISDDEYRDGLDRMWQAAPSHRGPVVEPLDLLVLR